MPGLGGEQTGNEVVARPLEEEIEKLGFPGRQRDGALGAVENAGRFIEVNAR